MSLKKIFYPKDPFVLESNESIENLQIAYHTYGNLNKEKNNVVWGFHALSANSDILNWWSILFGKGKIFDPEKYFIVCANNLGSPYGSSSPKSLAFPFFTARDVVNAHLLLAKHLNIEKIDTIIGGSFGGNQALEFAHSFEGHIETMIILAATAKETAWGQAIHHAQRLALYADPSFGKLGQGKAGLKAARGQAMLCYRTPNSFIDRQTDEDNKLQNFKAASYIEYQGKKFLERFDSLSYLYLINCLDTQNIGRNRGGCEKTLANIKIPSLVIGIDSDLLIPLPIQKHIADHLHDCQYKEIDSNYGHDGFLVEGEKLSKVISHFMKKEKVY